MFVRTRDKDFFVFPGGKQEQGETIEGALIRELDEELQVGVRHVQEMGMVEGMTPDGRPMIMYLFTADIVGSPVPHAEIVEVLWCSPDDVINYGDRMTPMTKEKVLPYLRTKGLF